MSTNITFRTQLLGSLYEFCNKAALPILNDALNMTELVVLLARYKEEGVKLCPQVYLTNNIDRICSLLPDGEKLRIGVALASVDGIKETLKKCAPLAANGWHIYVENTGEEIRYGVFRPSLNPVSVLMDDVIMTPDDELNVVKAFPIADECVEIAANNGLRHYIFLDHRKEDAPPPLVYLDQLIAYIVQDVIDTLREPVSGFLKRQLYESLRHAHGCLIAVTHLQKPPKFLSTDGVILEHPIDFPRLVEDLLSGKISTEFLWSKGSLVTGMLNSDGILLFDTRGRLLGYNCFVKLNSKSTTGGGARKRAFAAMEAKLHSGLTAAFIQSQDGWSELFGGAKND
jgi:hypothetical protein